MGKIAVSTILSFILLFSYAILANASGKVVFLKHVMGQGSHICTMSPDGTDVRRLTEKPDQYMYPKWSPDGTKIAYITTVALQLWMMNADGTSPELLCMQDVGLGGASWSPERTG